MKTPSILLSGFKKSGKDTFGDILLGHLKEFYKIEGAKYSLAYKLKKACSVISGLPIEYMTDQDLKEKVLDKPINLGQEQIKLMFDMFDVKVPKKVLKSIPDTVHQTTRTLMQFGGTDVLRHASPDIHCIVTQKVIQKEKPQFFLISDCRFHNELKFFGTEGFFIDRKSAYPALTADLHASEKIMFEIKEKIQNIDNNSTLEALNEQAVRLAEKIAKNL